MSVCGWCVCGECRSRGEHSYLGLLPDEEEVCNGDRERVSIHAWPRRSNMCTQLVTVYVTHNVFNNSLVTELMVCTN